MTIRSTILSLAVVALGSVALPQAAEASVAVTLTGPETVEPGGVAVYTLDVKRTDAYNAMTTTDVIFPRDQLHLMAEETVIGNGTVTSCHIVDSGAFECFGWMGSTPGPTGFTGPMHRVHKMTMRVRDEVACGDTITVSAKGRVELFNSGNVTTAAPVVCPPEPEAMSDTGGEKSKDTEESDEKAVRIAINDQERDITRPGHTFRYLVAAANTGNGDVSDAVIKQTVPTQFKIIGTSPTATVNGQTIIWREQSIEAGANKAFNVTVQVKKDAEDVPQICTTVTVNSEEQDVSDEASECIGIKSNGAGQVDTKAAHQVKGAIATPKPIVEVAVPATADVGAGLISVAMTLAGGAGLMIRKLIA